MRKSSRRHITNKQEIQNKLHYNLDEAITKLKKTANTKFIETFELHANLNLNPKYTDQQLRTTLTLPHSLGKTIKIAVLTTEENFVLLDSVGADIYGNDTLIEQITKGELNFDLLITTPNMMPKLAKLGRILGPKGLMPSPKAGTVTNNLLETINDFKKGKFEYKADKTGSVHIGFGKSNFTTEHLIENFNFIYKSIEQNRPTGVKGKYFKSLFICTSMGPSIKLDLNIFV